jgi:hypothetical protein
MKEIIIWITSSLNEMGRRADSYCFNWIRNDNYCLTLSLDFMKEAGDWTHIKLELKDNESLRLGSRGFGLV